MWILIGRKVENEPVTYRISWDDGHLRFEPPDIRRQYVNTIRPGTIAIDAGAVSVAYDEAVPWVAFRAARQTLWNLGARRMRVEGDGWQRPARPDATPP